MRQRGNHFKILPIQLDVALQSSSQKGSLLWDRLWLLLVFTVPRLWTHLLHRWSFDRRWAPLSPRYDCGFHCHCDCLPRHGSISSIRSRFGGREIFSLEALLSFKWTIHDRFFIRDRSFSQQSGRAHRVSRCVVQVPLSEVMGAQGSELHGGTGIEGGTGGRVWEWEEHLH